MSQSSFHKNPKSERGATGRNGRMFLERELGVPDGAMIRRALCERLRPDLERGGDRPGVRTQLVLQPLGYWVVVDFFAEVQLNREEINGRP